MLNKFGLIAELRRKRCRWLRLTDTMTEIAANEPNFPFAEPTFAACSNTRACNLNSAGLKCGGLIEISMVQVFERHDDEGKGEGGGIREDSCGTRDRSFSRCC